MQVFVRSRSVCSGGEALPGEVSRYQALTKEKIVWVPSPCRSTATHTQRELSRRRGPEFISDATKRAPLRAPSLSKQLTTLVVVSAITLTRALKLDLVRHVAPAGHVPLNFDAQSDLKA